MLRISESEMLKLIMWYIFFVAKYQIRLISSCIFGNVYHSSVINSRNSFTSKWLSIYSNLNFVELEWVKFLGFANKQLKIDKNVRWVEMDIESDVINSSEVENRNVHWKLKKESNFLIKSWKKTSVSGNRTQVTR